MKISELSQKAGIPLPTIKFYIREGLLPPGVRTQKNQSDYGAGHLERLELIRSLRDDAGLPIETIARALRAADSAKRDFISLAIDALSRPPPATTSTSSPAYRKAARAVSGIAKKRGWAVDEKDAAFRDAVLAVSSLSSAFPLEGEEALMPYADAVERIADCEIPEDWAPEGSRESALRYAVLGTVLFEPLILALRRMAHLARSRKIAQKRKKTRG